MVAVNGTTSPFYALEISVLMALMSYLTFPAMLPDMQSCRTSLTRTVVQMLLKKYKSFLLTNSVEKYWGLYHSMYYF